MYTVVRNGTDSCTKAYRNSVCVWGGVPYDVMCVLVFH